MISSGITALAVSPTSGEKGAEVIGKTTGKAWNIRKDQNCVCEFMGKSWKINRVSRLEWNGERGWTCIAFKVGTVLILMVLSHVSRGNLGIISGHFKYWCPTINHPSNHGMLVNLDPKSGGQKLILRTIKQQVCFASGFLDAPSSTGNIYADFPRPGTQGIPNTRWHPGSKWPCNWDPHTHTPC